MIAKYDDVVAEWRKLCNSDLVEVTGRSMECGHFIAEESSEELLQEIFEFLSVINDDDNVDRAGTIIS
jgi:haloacetate dehalogenase